MGLSNTVISAKHQLFDKCEWRLIYVIVSFGHLKCRHVWLHTKHTLAYHNGLLWLKGHQWKTHCRVLWMAPCTSLVQNIE